MLEIPNQPCSIVNVTNQIYPLTRILIIIKRKRNI